MNIIRNLFDIPFHEDSVTMSKVLLIKIVLQHLILKHDLISNEKQNIVQKDNNCNYTYFQYRWNCMFATPFLINQAADT